LKRSASDRSRKVQLLDDILEAETALQNAHDAFRAGSGDWEAVNRFDRDYRQVIDETNTFIYTILDDQESGLSERTSRWQESEKGRAYREWMDEWDVEILLDELAEPWQGGDLELNALGMLQELPDEPRLCNRGRGCLRARGR